MWMVAYLLVGAVFLFGIWQYVTLPNNTGLLKDNRLDTAGLWNKTFRRDLIHKERLIIGLTYLKIIVSSLRVCNILPKLRLFRQPNTKTLGGILQI